MAKPSGKKNGNASSEKNSDKNVLPTPEQHRINKLASKAGKRRRSTGLSQASGKLGNFLAYKSHVNAEAAAKTAASREASAKIAGARAYTSRSV